MDICGKDFSARNPQIYFNQAYVPTGQLFKVGFIFYKYPVPTGHFWRKYLEF